MQSAHGTETGSKLQGLQITEEEERKPVYNEGERKILLRRKIQLYNEFY